jgi:hypothetical protein
MPDWFSEKSSQVEPGTLMAFGIEINSRYNHASEIIQMIQFAEECAKKNVEKHVERAFYDSKACICSFELDSKVRRGDKIAKAILMAASRTITQFMWFDDIRHAGE